MMQAILRSMLPKLGKHQHAMLTPGIFGCGNESANPLAQQEQRIVAKLKGYWAWAVKEPRIGGFAPWHFGNRGSHQVPGSPCDMALGAASFPTVVAQLRRMSAPALQVLVGSQAV